MTRYKIVCDCVERWCRMFELAPWFWKTNLGGDQLKSKILTNPDGTEEDRADCIAMIVGTLTVKGFIRQELESYLGLGSGTIWRYWNHYQSIPESTKIVLLRIDGELAPAFWRSVIVDSKIEQIKRLKANRDYIEEHRN